MTSRSSIRSALAAFTLLAATAACIPVDEIDEETDKPSESVGVPVTRMAQVEGEWNVVSFDGYRPPLRVEGSTTTAFVRFHGDGVGFRIGCNYSGAGGSIERGRFVTSDSAPPAQTLMGCEPDAEQRDTAFFAFFGKEPTIEKIGDDRLRMVAGSQILELERPEKRRLAFVPKAEALDGEWRLDSLTRLDSQGGMSGMGLMEVPGRIAFEKGTLEYTRCPALALRYDWREPGRMVKTGGADLPASPSGCTELSEPPFQPGQLALWDVLKVMHGNPLVERTGEDTIMLETPDHRLVLTRKPCVQLNQSDDHSRSWEEDCASPE